MGLNQTSFFPSIAPFTQLLELPSSGQPPQSSQVGAQCPDQVLLLLHHSFQHTLLKLLGLLPACSPHGKLW